MTSNNDNQRGPGAGAEPGSIQQVLAWRAHELPRVRTLLALRRWWMTDLYARLRAEWQACGGPTTAPIVEPPEHGDMAAAETAAAAMEAAAPIVAELPSTPTFAWLDRYLQDRLWQEVGVMVDERIDELDTAVAPRDGDLGNLGLDPGVVMPRYYEAIDFHRQAGGIWRDTRGAAIYAMGARVIHVGRNDANELHDRFAADVPLDDPSVIVDVACGFGKTTLSLAKRWPRAEVIAVDLSVPCLHLGRRLATEAGRAVSWRQGAAEQLPVDDGVADLVTITMALHEMPPRSIEAALAEGLRVLRPGGMLVALENRLLGDPLRDVLGAWHSEIIEEPYMNPFRATDVAARARAAGFTAEARPWYPPGAVPGAELDPARWSSPWRLLVATSPALVAVGGPR